MKKKEKIIIALIVALAVISIAVIAFKNNQKQYAQVININTGEEIMRFDINEDAYYELDVPFGKFHIEVKDGKYHATDVDCPNQTCVSLGWVPTMDTFYTPIICFPNGIQIVLVD